MNNFSKEGNLDDMVVVTFRCKTCETEKKARGLNKEGADVKGTLFYT